MTWQAHLKKLLIPRPVAGRRPPRVDAGLYHYQRPRDGGYLRYHLRVDPDGSGLLIAGAAEVLRLSPAGVWVAKQLLDGRPAADLAQDPALPHGLVEDVARRVDELGRPRGRFPVFNLADAAAEDSPELFAPLEAHLVPGDQRTTREILDRLWAAGIPHVRFRGLGPSAAAGHGVGRLVDAVRHAEDLGMISGVAARASELTADNVLAQLSDVGLDYAVIPWCATRELHETLLGPGDFDRFDEAVATVRRREMCPVVSLPLIPATAAAVEDELPGLLKRQATNVEIFAIAEDVGRDAGAGPRSAVSGAAGADQGLRPFAARELRQAAARVEELAASLPAQIVWLPPVQFSAGDSLAQRAQRGPRAGGDISIRVEADGQVTAPRGPRVSAGNLLGEPWKNIWRHPAFARFRRRVESLTRCDVCPGLSICAADCPSDPRGWASD